MVEIALIAILSLIIFSVIIAIHYVIYYIWISKKNKDNLFDKGNIKKIEGENYNVWIIESDGDTEIGDMSFNKIKDSKIHHNTDTTKLDKKELFNLDEIKNINKYGQDKEKIKVNSNIKLEETRKVVI